MVVPGYGYSWVPARVETDWRPYSDGYWQRTDAGWYWMSEEPWGWATYHYGRWDWNVQFGWFWVPQTQWAPAWVCWREGGGYVGWAPLRPSVSIGINFTSVDYEPAFASRAFVFVEHRRMLEHVRPRTVVVNNTTIINKTVNITKVRVEDKTVINEGPRPDVIERESGRKIQSVAARDFRHREETAVARRNRNIVRNNEHKVEPPVRRTAEPRPVPTPSPRQEQPVKSGAVVTQRSVPARPTTVISPAPSSPKREEVIREERRKPDAVTGVIAPRQAAERKSRVASPATRPIPNRPPARIVEKAVNGVPKAAQAPVPSNLPRSEVRPKQGQPDFSARRLIQPAANNSKAEAKRETESLAKHETKPPVSKISRPTAPTANAAEKAVPTAREKSRPSDPSQARAKERNNGREAERE
jgi:hypothetical protein